MSSLGIGAIPVTASSPVRAAPPPAAGVASDEVVWPYSADVVNQAILAA